MRLQQLGFCSSIACACIPSAALREQGPGVTRKPQTGKPLTLNLQGFARCVILTGDSFKGLGCGAFCRFIQTLAVLISAGHEDPETPKPLS